MNNEFLEVCPIGYHALVDRHHEVWGWEIVAYLFLGGLVAGLMVHSAFLEIRARRTPATRALRWMPFGAIVLISLGMVALFLDLGDKSHFYRFHMALEPASPMSWGAWILLVIYPATFLQGLGALNEGERSWLKGLGVLRVFRLGKLVDWVFRVSDSERDRILWTNVVVGVALGLYTGLLLGTMVARVQWNSAVLGPLFLFSGLSSGAAFMLLFPMEHDFQKRLIRWDVYAIAAELFFIALMLVSFAGGSASAQQAAENLMGGEWTAQFWSLVVFAGLVVPLMIGVVEMTRRLPMTVVAPLLVLAGGIALRAILLEAGQELCFCEMTHAAPV